MFTTTDTGGLREYNSFVLISRSRGGCECLSVSVIHLHEGGLSVGSDLVTAACSLTHTLSTL